MSENQGITVQEFNIFALGGEAVSYHLKDIHTIALQVTPQNIGILSLELEVELRYDEFANPYVTFAAARGSAENPERDRGLMFRPDDWIVILWDEIHKFRDPEFKATFSFDVPPASEVGVEEGRLIAAGKHIGDPVIPRTAGAPSMFKPIISKGEWVQIHEDEKKKLEELVIAGGELKDALERPPWIPNDAIPMVETTSGNLAWLRPDAYRDLADNVKKLYRPYEKESEKTQIVASVGELDTDETNGKVE